LGLPTTEPHDMEGEARGDIYSALARKVPPMTKPIPIPILIRRRRGAGR
jgi:hypothetical protein